VLVAGLVDEHQAGGQQNHAFASDLLKLMLRRSAQTAAAGDPSANSALRFQSSQNVVRK
jgi:hypothetical protein